MAPHLHYFAYGSNMLSTRLIARAPSARAAGLGSVAGMSLQFHKTSTDGSGKCDMVIGQSGDSVVPWREVAVPHEDVLKGTFQQAEFAADLSRVHEGTATPEYQNPALFFQRTFITEGMRLLLDSVVKRLSGKGGDPVIQLQTAFGGGKTHTMLAVYHLAKGEVAAERLTRRPAILDAAGVTELPRARVAVTGRHQVVAQPARDARWAGDDRTLWGDLAWQLGKAEGYALVADADASGTSPGKAVLETLLSRYAPVRDPDRRVGGLRAPV
jgi:predicted AAA+ superfamily ATPase